MKPKRTIRSCCFEALPDVFTPMLAGALLWSWVDIEPLTRRDAAGSGREPGLRRAEQCQAGPTRLRGSPMRPRSGALGAMV